MRAKPLIIAPVALALAGGVAACGEEDDKANKTSDTAATAQASEAAGPKSGENGERVAITGVQPSPGGFTARVSLANVKLAPKQVGKASKAGEGHLHFELDGGKYDRPKHSGANGKLAVQLGTDGKYSPSVQPNITYDNLPPGRHVLEVYVANNDHSDSGAVAERVVTVE